jgi:hypothetical protein
VVTSAISTMIVNTAVMITPSSSPTLRMTSSVSPRVFISTPMAAASCHDSPVTRAAGEETDLTFF